jgi:hypothetical protein
MNDTCEREHGALASALQRFASLKEFKFTNDDNCWACLDIAIAALIGHSGCAKPPSLQTPKCCRGTHIDIAM